MVGLCQWWSCANGGAVPMVELSACMCVRSAHMYRELNVMFQMGILRGVAINVIDFSLRGGYIFLCMVYTLFEYN